MLEVGDIEDAPEARRAIKDFVGVDDQVGVLAPARHHRHRAVRRAEIAAMERGDVIICGQEARRGAVLHVEHEEARVTPGEIEAIVIGDDLVALDDLRLAVGPVAIERPELLALALAGNVPGADLANGGRIAIVDDLQPFAIELGRVL